MTENDSAESTDLPPAPTPEPSSSSDAAPPKPPAEDHRLEMFVFFCLGVLVPLVTALYAFSVNAYSREFTKAYSLFHLCYSVAAAVPALYLLSRTREGWAHFAVVRPEARRDITAGVVLGLLLFGFALAFWTLSFRYLPPYLLSEVTQRPRGPAPPEDFIGIMLFFSSNAANGISEELFMRCYFMTRIKDQTGSWLKAAVYSSALFASYHIYHGVYPMVSVFFVGLVLAAAFLLLRRLWPLAIGHMVLNILVIYLPLGQTLSG